MTHVRNHHRRAHIRAGRPVRSTYVHDHNRRDRYKHLGYRQLHKRFKIKPYADDDRDGVVNKKDCRPWDKFRQDEEMNDEIWKGINIDFSRRWLDLRRNIKYLQDKKSESETGNPDEQEELSREIDDAIDRLHGLEAEERRIEKKYGRIMDGL